MHHNLVLNTPQRLDILPVVVCGALWPRAQFLPIRPLGAVRALVSLHTHHGGKVQAAWQTYKNSTTLMPTALRYTVLPKCSGI